MSRFNPSAVLTLAQVDAAIDLIMKGISYCSPRERAQFPTPKTAMLLRMDGRHWGNVREYCNSRWRNSLTERGLSRRVNTLSAKVNSLVSQMGPDDDSVWRISTRGHGELGFVCAANEHAARELGWTMFAWAWVKDLGAGSSSISAERVGMGGWTEAASLNLKIVSSLRASIQTEEQRIVRIRESIDNNSSRIEAITSAIMMGGDDSESQVAS